MGQYIDKAAVVAGIEKCYNECFKRAKIVDADYWNGQVDAYRNVLTILDDTIEVKEVDLEKEMDEWRHNHFCGARDDKGAAGEWLTRKSQLDIAKHFFELGIKTKENKLWQK